MGDINKIPNKGLNIVDKFKDFFQNKNSPSKQISSLGNKNENNILLNGGKVMKVGGLILSSIIDELIKAMTIGMSQGNINNDGLKLYENIGGDKKSMEKINKLDGDGLNKIKSILLEKKSDLEIQKNTTLDYVDSIKKDIENLNKQNDDFKKYNENIEKDDLSNNKESLKKVIDNEKNILINEDKIKLKNDELDLKNDELKDIELNIKQIDENLLIIEEKLKKQLKLEKFISGSNELGDKNIDKKHIDNKSIDNKSIDNKSIDIDLDNSCKKKLGFNFSMIIGETITYNKSNTSFSGTITGNFKKVDGDYLIEVKNISNLSNEINTYINLKDIEIIHNIGNTFNKDIANNMKELVNKNFGYNLQ